MSGNKYNWNYLSEKNENRRVIVGYRRSIFLSVIICLTILGVFSLIGASFGTLGLSVAFKILGGIGFLFLVLVLVEVFWNK